MKKKHFTVGCVGLEPGRCGSRDDEETSNSNNNNEQVEQSGPYGTLKIASVDFS